MLIQKDRVVFKTNGIFKSEIWQLLVTILPIAFIILLVSFWEPLFTTIPDKNDLKVISGSLNKIGKKCGSVQTSDGKININYECLCNHGWGVKSFQEGMHVFALGQQDGASYKLWEFEINGTKIFEYNDIATKKLESENLAKVIGYPGIFLSLALMVQLALQKINGREYQKKLKLLYGLLDELADTALPDSKRLAHLDNILTYKPGDIVEPLEVIAMNNNNSDEFLSRIGACLGELWSEMEVEYVEAITYIQPSAKASAIIVLKSKNTELLAKLREVGVVIA